MDLDNVKHVHIIAICGTAMGAIAGLLKKRGFKVTGSDEGVYPPMSDYLKSLGIEIMEGFKPENLDVNPDLVIVGNTVKRTNPEAAEMRKRGIPYMHLPGAVSEFFLKQKHPVVIGGTHGKTTTTALCSWVFHSAGLDPGFLVGGVARNFNCNARIGNGDFFVIEGDEYDTAYFEKTPKFWHYRPKTAVIVSVEFDHGDIYRDLEHVKEAFSRFVSIIPPDGLLVACVDYPAVREVISRAGCRVIRYSLKDNVPARLTDVMLDEKGSRFTLHFNGRRYSFRSPLWGRHNVSNAAAVILIALSHGLSSGQIQSGLDSFKGIKRRQEIIYDDNGITVIDDFAHHPTKVRETVKAVRGRFPDRRLISIFEPRTNTSRRNFFQDKYPDSFLGSDVAIIAPVYHPDQIEPGKMLNVKKLARDIGKRGIEAVHIESIDEIVSYVGKIANEGDVILIMSNGGFGGIYSKIKKCLSEL